MKMKKVFFIGIGGIGISALAKWMKSMGMAVSGLNDEKNGKILDSLSEVGINVNFDNKLEEADTYVYSDAWIYRGPEIIKEAKKTGKPVLSYFEMLGSIAKDYKVIAVSGTHGKTTTTAMVAEILEAAGLDPTVIVGSFIKKYDSNFKKGASKYLVVEADEYNRHFLNFHPYIGVVTNIEADHLDYYKNLEDIKDAFNKFILQSEHAVVNYSKYLEKVPELQVPGVHNRMNAAAALAVAAILKIDEQVAYKALANFSGTWRRLEKRGETKEGVIVYDDYAHHPTEIKASIEALRELYSNQKLTILFQPHLYSRTKALFTDFAKSFKDADQILLLPIYFAREAKDESVSSDKLALAIAQNGQNAKAFGTFGEAEDYVRGLALSSGDIFVTMGAGEAYKIADAVFDLAL